MTDVDVTSIAMGWGLLSRYRVASVFSACEHLEQGMGDPEASSVSCVPMTNQSDICDLVFRVEGEAWEEVFIREERSSWVRIPLLSEGALVPDRYIQQTSRVGSWQVSSVVEAGGHTGRCSRCSVEDGEAPLACVPLYRWHCFDSVHISHRFARWLPTK